MACVARAFFLLSIAICGMNDRTTPMLTKRGEKKDGLAHGKRIMIHDPQINESESNFVFGDKNQMADFSILIVLSNTRSSLMFSGETLFA